jgi:hypothetical protein
MFVLKVNFVMVRAAKPLKTFIKEILIEKSDMTEFYLLI